MTKGEDILTTPETNGEGTLMLPTTGGEDTLTTPVTTHDYLVTTWHDITDNPCNDIDDLYEPKMLMLAIHFLYDGD